MVLHAEDKEWKLVGTLEEIPLVGGMFCGIINVFVTCTLVGANCNCIYFRQTKYLRVVHNEFPLIRRNPSREIHRGEPGKLILIVSSKPRVCKICGLVHRCVLVASLPDPKDFPRGRGIRLIAGKEVCGCIVV